MTGAWEPIETAPKDGTRIITYGCLHDDDGVDMGETAQVHVSWWRVDGGWVCSEWGSHEPTHWQPLPPPPPVETEEGGPYEPPT